MLRKKIQITGKCLDYIILYWQVELLVLNEFEIALTRLGDNPQTKWCLLDIRIMVENFDVGQGQALVHPLQVCV